MRDLLPFFSPGLVSIITIATVVLVLVLGNFLLNRVRRENSEQRLQRQLTKLLLSLFGTVTIIISLPISPGLRGQILSFLGLLISAAIALSSTTFLGNIMAGIMLRIINNYHVGDFIQVKEHFGRVTGNSLFHLEIQGDDRNLTTLPNVFVVSNPVKVIPNSGTIVKAEVSLGYDVPRRTIEKLLLQAAGGVGLEAPFVQVMSLGDFAVTYRVSGLLKDVFQHLTVRSNLKAKILDVLHENGVEIVSPTFMNQRVVTGRTFIPRKTREPEPSSENIAAEGVVFDKADKAMELENMRQLLHETEAKIRMRTADLGRAVYAGEVEAIEQDLDSKRLIKVHLEERIASLSGELKVGQ
ncbi:mechanosensitive ion channel family protein [Myxococcota bacterium]|nr:mechanosensitive ion channel family protein [Myxococcota bacterium]